MTGQELRDKLLVANVPFNEIADRLGVTAQSLNSCFKVKDVRSNTIERIAEAIGVNMSFFYPMENGSVVATGNGNVAIKGNNNITGNNNVAGNVTMSDNVAVLSERVKSLETLIDEKNERIAELKERIEELKEKK